MSEIGNLSVRLTADTSDLDAGITKAGQGMRRFRASAMPAIKAMAAMGAAATAAAGAVLAFGRAGMNAIDAQAKLARQLDSTIGGLRGLQLAASDAGISTNVINGAMERFSARLGEAERGTGQAADALDRLGLSARDLAGMDVDQRMAAIADQVHRLGLSGAQTADLLRQFGIRNREIVNLMRQGGDAIREARQEVEDYGLAIDAVDASMIEAANDAFSRVGLVVESVRNALAHEMAPVVLEIADRFNTAAREAGGWGSMVTDGAQIAIVALGKVADAVHRVRLANAQVERATAEMNLAFAQFAERAWTSMSGLFDNIIRGINNVLRAFELLPGVDDIPGLAEFSSGEFMEGVRNNTDRATQAAWGARQAFAELAEQQLPSDRIDEFFDAIERRRQEMAERVADGGGSSIFPGFGDDDEGGGTGQQERLEKEQERLQEHLGNRLDLIRESLMEEGELETQRFMEKMEQLHEAREMELLGEQEHQELMRGLAEQHHDKLNAIEQRAADERAQANERAEQMIRSMREQTVRHGIGLLNQFAGESKAAAIAAIALNKALSIAQAMQNTAVAVTKAYTLDPTGALAAKVAAMGKIQIGLIAATGLAQAAGTVRGGASGGVGAVGGIGGAAGAGPGAGQAQQQQAPIGGTLTVEGISSSALFTGEAVKELANELIEFQRRGGEITIA